MSVLPVWLFLAVAKVSYSASEERGAWQPIDLDDVTSVVEHAALEVLSSGGALRLTRAEPQKSAEPRDYDLKITGRMLDESESHTVYLQWTPHQALSESGEALTGSFSASDTSVIGKLPRLVMLQKIEVSARAAAAQLKRVIDKATHPSSATTPSAETIQLPWKWPEVEVVSAGASAAELNSADSQKAQAALRELGSQALSGSSAATDPARRALEACALNHHLAQMRLQCLEALLPIARTNPHSQRVVVSVFRKDRDDKVVAAANEQMLYFTGLAQTEATQAWLEAAARGVVVGPLQMLGDVANLDVVVAKCLLASAQKPKYQRSKRPCLDLMSVIPQPRRKAILWRFLSEQNPDSPFYLEGAGERESSIGTDWQKAVDLVIEGAHRFEPGLEDLLWARFERTLSSSSLNVLADEAPPSATLLARLAQALQGAEARTALRGCKRIAKSDRTLTAKVRDVVAELLATSGYHKSLSSSDLESFLKETAS